MPTGSENARDRELFGVFKEPPSLAAGDPYKDANPIPERYKGKQFAAPYQPKGAGPDAMIDKTTPLRVPGDMYYDPIQIQRKLNKSLGKPITTKAFIPSAPAQKPSGPGSTYGLIGPPILDTDPSMAARTSSNIRALGKRNIYVNPPKKGTYGFPWQERTIGGSQLSHMPDAYAPGAEITRKLRAEARAKLGKPFVAMGRTGAGIVAVPLYGDGGPPRPQRPATTGRIASHPKQWRPCGGSQKGHGDFGCLNRLEYVPQLPSKPKARPQTSGAFIPPGGLHNRLSMWSPNAYAYEARPPPDNDMSLLG